MKDNLLKVNLIIFKHHVYNSCFFSILKNFPSTSKTKPNACFIFYKPIVL